MQAKLCSSILDTIIMKCIKFMLKLSTAYQFQAKPFNSMQNTIQ
jgi:hypothetical protein